MIIWFFFMTSPQNGHRRSLSCKKARHKMKRGCAQMERIKSDQMQEIRMCFQTYFNLYGTSPSEQEMLEWLGISYEKQIPEYLDQLCIA